MFKSAELKPSFNADVIDRSKLKVHPELLQNLEKYNLGLSVQRIDKLLSLISDTNVNLGIKPFKAHSSTAEKPCVILEHGASVCSLLVGIDHDGNIASLHEPFIAKSATEILDALSLTGFLDERQKLGPDPLYFMTATGASVSNDRRNEMVADLERALGATIHFLFLDDSPPESPLLKSVNRLKEMLKNLFQGKNKENYLLNMISQILIIPAAVSVSHKTEIVIPYPADIVETGLDSFKQSREFMKILKEKLNYQPE